MRPVLLTFLLLLLAAAAPAAANPCTKHTDCPQDGAPTCKMRLCNKGTCNPGFSPISGQFCNDGDPCTAADRCKAGVCTGGIRIQTPACVAPEETWPLCELSAPSAGVVLACPVRLDAAGESVTALQLVVGVPRGLVLHGVYARRYVEGVGIVALPLASTLDVKTGGGLQSGHSVTLAPWDAARFPTVDALGMVVLHLSDPGATIGPEPLEVRFVALAPGEWTVLASGVRGSAPGAAGKGQFDTLRPEPSASGGLRLVRPTQPGGVR